MAKEKNEAAKEQKPAEVRPQSEEEVRKRLRDQGKLKKDSPNKGNGWVRELPEEEAQVRMAKRTERLKKESEEENKGVRLLSKKDIALRLAAEKKRDLEKEGTEAGRVLTEDDIKARTKPKPEPDEVTEPKSESEPEPKPGENAEPGSDGGTEPDDDSEPTEIFAKDMVSFKDDDGTIVTGVVKRVTAKNEAIIETEEAVYTVPCADLVKEKEEE